MQRHPAEERWLALGLAEMGLALVLLASILDPHGAEEHAGNADGPGLQRAVLEVLDSRLRCSCVSGSAEILEDVSNASRVEISACREALVALLDSLDCHRRRNSREWLRLMVAGSGAVGGSETGVFLHTMVKDARAVLRQGRTVSLDLLLARAAHRAGIPNHAGRDVLLRALAYGRGAVHLPPIEVDSLPSRLSLYVDVQSRLGTTPVTNRLRWFFVIPVWVPKGEVPQEHEDFFIIKLLEGLHVQLQPLLIEALRHSPRVANAVEHRIGEQYDYRLRVTLSSFEVVGLGGHDRDIGCVRVAGMLAILPGVHDYLVADRPFAVVSRRMCRMIGEDDGSATDLTPLCVEIASTVRDALTALPWKAPHR